MITDRMYLHNIKTFEDHKKYTDTAIAVLNMIDKHVKDTSSAPLQKNNVTITKSSYGVGGHCYPLQYFSKGIMSACYFNLSTGDETWVKVHANKCHELYGFEEFSSPEFDVFIERPTDTFFSEHDVTTMVRFDVKDYNEEMYEQLQFVYPQAFVNIAFAISVISASDPNRDFRQFCLYENVDISILEMHDILQEMLNVI